MAQCWFCHKVKGKRACPARSGELICSRCCGSKRRVAIPCPADCAYLEGAHDPKWLSKTQEREQSRFLARLLSLEEPSAQFFLFLHHLLLSTVNPLLPLGDGELAEVVSTSGRTLDTLSKGVVYAHQTTNPQLQHAAEWLSRVVSGRKSIEGAPDVSDREATDAVVALAATVEAHVRDEAKDRYLEMTRKLLSESLGERPAPTLPRELDEPPRRLIVSS